MRELLTSQSQACWQERIRKEVDARAAWSIRYGRKYLKERTEAKAREQPQLAPSRAASAVAPRPATSAYGSKERLARRPETQGGQWQPSRKVDVQGPPPQGDRVWEDRRATPDPAGQRPAGLEMRQVPPSTLKLLFQGISHDGQGRARYLQERYQQTPKEKFPYPVVSSWDYGWYVGDATRDPKVPAYARMQPIAKAFYIKSDIFYVPRRTDQLM